jgi:hypothetical protein
MLNEIFSEFLLVIQGAFDLQATVRQGTFFKPLFRRRVRRSGGMFFRRHFCLLFFMRHRNLWLRGTNR